MQEKLTPQSQNQNKTKGALRRVVVMLLWTGVTQIILWTIVMVAAASLTHSTEDARRVGVLCGALAFPVLVLNLGVVGFLVVKGKLPGSRG